ncbi:PGF-pre-PGF domain-containing protein [Methanosarcina sp.]|uniref:PGF-pre-PGF domain-containing protein n=1 Tax=Methanosarcina sp. TaxID=2213 RepID=UPI003C70C34C
MKKLITLLTAMLIFALASGIGAANEIYVNSTDSIQAAVSSAVSGDVVIVKPGIYTENVRITKPDLVVRSESGKPEDTIVRAKLNTSAFYMAASNTTISGFKIESAETGIYMFSCSGCTVTNNYLSDNKIGINLYSSNYNKILGNRANSNKQYGIQLLNSEGNTLLNNSANSNERGINHLNSNKSTISGNNVSNNKNYGMWISLSNYNTISGNKANETSGGINLDSSSDNTLSENIVAFNNVSGFYECPACRRNLIFNNYANNVRNANINSRDTTWNIEKTSGRNIVGGPFIGGNFWAKPDGTGFSQTATDRDEDGIADAVYTGDLQNVTDYLPLALFSSPQQPILPVANFSASVTSGYAPLAVQFTNLSQDTVSWSWDFESDGNIDSNDKNPVHTYTIPGNYTANLTVSNENGTDSKTQEIFVQEVQHEDKIYPVADFSANVTSGYAPLSVLLTDLSQNATSRNWDFNKDEIGDSNESSLVYVYTAPGTYTVSLTAINANGTSPAKTAQINVMQVIPEDDDDEPSHSSGGGGSPEPARNVEVKELSQVRVTNGKLVKFDFTKNATCVVYVSFDSKRTAGKTTTIAEQLKTKSTLVSNLSSGEVYKYFNIWVGNSGFASSKNIENPVVCFKVEKAWLQDKKIDQASINLNRYSDKKWSQLPAKMLKEDDKYLYFTAETPEFSFFAITGKAIEKEAGIEIKPETSTSEINQNSTTVSETEQEQKPEQESLTGTSGSEKGSLTSIPGFETQYVIACLLVGSIISLNKRK